MGFDRIIQNRVSIKEFSNKVPKEEHILDIIEAGNFAPSPGNLAIVNYTIVENPETIRKIAQACQQEFIEYAPVVIIVCSNPKKVEVMYDKRADTYIKQQAGAAIQNMLLKITELKLASTWVGAFSELTLRNALKIPDGINIEAVLPIGIPIKKAHTKPKEKPPLEPRVFFEKYKNKEKIPMGKISQKRQ